MTVISPAAPATVPRLVGPVHVDLDLTNACNLGCSHCDVSSGVQLPDELGTQQLIDLITELNELGTLSLTVAGGEPFLRKDCVSLLEHACALPGWSVTVITNGTYFTASKAAEVAERCPDLTVNISLDGSTPSTFSRIRHRRIRSERADHALFELIERGFRHSVGAGLKTHANFALTRLNTDDLRATYDYAMSLGARDLLAIKFFSGGRGLDHMDTMEFDYGEWADLLLDLTREKMAGELDRLALSVPAPWEFYLPFADAGVPVERAEDVWGYRAPLREGFYSMSPAIGDPSGIADLNVVGNGTVYPITLMSGEESARCGSHPQESLLDIWETAPVLQQLRSMRRDGLSDCQGCSMLDVCGGGSRARALIRTGELDGPDVACPRLQHLDVQ